LSEGLEEFFTFGSVDGGIDAEMTGEDAIDITIDDSSWQSESDAPNGSSRIVANALQLFDLF
jgi:hypothetical protein